MTTQIFAATKNYLDTRAYREQLREWAGRMEQETLYMPAYIYPDTIQVIKEMRTMSSLLEDAGDIDSRRIQT